MTAETLHPPAFTAPGNAPDAFYLRPNLPDSLSGSIDQCPDIIAWLQPVADPQSTFGSQASWDTDYGAVPPVGTPGYIYVRGCNGEPDAMTPQVNLFAAPAQLIPWPSLWNCSALTTTSGSKVSVMTEVAPNAIGVTTAPFQWTPPQLADSSDFYGVYAWATDSSNPSPAPSAATFAEMAALLTQEPGLGISQIVTLDTNGGPWIATVGLSIPSTAIDDAAIMLTVTGSGLNDAFVGLIGFPFTSSKSAILLQPSALADGHMLGITIDLQAGYNGSLTLQVWPGTQPPEDAAALVVTASYKVPTSQAGAFAKRGALSSRPAHLAMASGLARAEAGVEPTASAVLGGFTAMFSNANT